MKKNNNKKIISPIYYFISFMLVGFWLIFSILFINYTSFSTLIHNENRSQLSEDYGNLTKGQMIIGQFSAKDNYLGLVVIKFEKYVKPDYEKEDLLEFRIREASIKQWMYSGKFRSGMVEGQEKFPIGFPVIEDSKDKDYIFEIVSLNGNNDNSLTLEKGNQIFSTGYQIPKSNILSNIFSFSDFILKKIYYSFTDLVFILSSLIFLLPLSIFLLYLIFVKRPISIIKYMPVVTANLIGVDIFLINDFYNGIFFNLLILCIASFMLGQYKRKVLFDSFLVLSFIWLVSEYFQFGYFSNKLSVWSFCFLVLGIGNIIISDINLKSWLRKR